MSANINIDGPALLKISPAEFVSLMGSKESDTLREFLCHWLSLTSEANSKIGLVSGDHVDQLMQVKLESDLKQVKQEVVPLAMLPASVVNHNQLQGASNNSFLPEYKQATQMQQSSEIQSSQEQQKQFRNYQQQINVHQQPQNGSDHLIQAKSSSLPHFSMGQNVQVFNQQSFSQRPAPSNLQHPITKQTTATSIISQGSHSLCQMNPVPHHQKQTTTLTKPASPVEPQHQSLSQPNSNIVMPLQEGVNGYVDDSGANLSSLVQQTSQQHPATLDQEDQMDTDGELKIYVYLLII